MNVVRQDYTQVYKLLILQYLKDAENINKIFEIKGLRRNEQEALFFSILDHYYLDTAIGAQLDIIGKIVGIQRDGRTDDNYRILIRLKQKINNSSGNIQILIDTIRILFSATFVHYIRIDEEPATINLFQDGQINLSQEFNAITEEGENFQFDTFGDWNGLTEEGDHFITEDFDSLIFYDTGYGDQIIFAQPDSIDESILYDIIPAGVGIYFCSYGVTEELDYFATESGDYILF